MDIENLSHSSIVICDDSITSVTILSKLLESEGLRNQQNFTDPREVIPYLQQIKGNIDLLILDIEMPHINGIEIMAEIDKVFRKRRPFAILVITGLQNREIRHKALVAGANDFIDKPFDQMEVMLRVRNLLRVQRVLKTQTQLAQELERQVQERTQQLAAINEALEEKVALRTHELLRAEKMASVGRLAAGVAHEINNPLGFIRSNLGSLKNYGGELFDLLDNLVTQLGNADAQRSLIEQADLEFLRDDLFSTIDESCGGLERVARIVQSLKTFSHINQAEIQESDLNQDLESSLQMAGSALDQRIEVIRDFGSIPKVRCIPAQINQVFFNLIINAAQAIEAQGRLTLSTRADQEWVNITISDTGRGISADALQRIFDPFYTTKQIGKGMGLGLSEAYTIINQHGGQIEVSSELERGSSFDIRLPINNPHLSL